MPSSNVKIADVEKKPKVMLGCCLCNKPIDLEKIEATIIIEGTGQNFWVHKKCLKNHMHPDLKGEL